EGELSQIRSSLVDAKQCAKYVEKLGVEEFLRLGKGEMANLGRGRGSILSDLFEAIMGAIYLDGGYDAAKKFFFFHFENDLSVKPDENYKAQFQDFVQKRFGEQPVYFVEKELGPDHDKEFAISVFVGDEKWGSGIGPSKKQAEQNAAKAALRKT
ncbi:MAG: putative dsRNA-binding protein, partial [Simkaniaceae bacterium]|nr:putative dsRNA-binding protein [Simkaniaceae bacterium]